MTALSRPWDLASSEVRLIRISDKLQLIGSTFLAQALRVATTLVLARLVTRNDYGLFTLIGSIPGLISLGDLGIPASLIRMRHHDDRVRDTAVTLCVALYLIYGALIVGGGAYFSLRYHDYRLWVVGLIMGVTSLLGVLYNVQLADLNRRLDFRAESRQNMIFAFSQTAAGILFAILGWGIFALALQAFVGQIIANAAIHRRSQLRIPRSFSFSVAKEFVLLGGGVGLAAYVGNVRDSVLNLLIGRVAGPGPVGDWGRSTQVQSLFSQNLMVSIERVAYPNLCRAISLPERLRDLFTKTTVVLMLVGAFTGAWLIGTRVDLVALGLGSQWTRVPPILAVVALAVPAAAFYSISYNTWYALGRAGMLLKVSIVNTILSLPVLAIVAHQGLGPVAWTWVASQWFIALANFVGLIRVIRPPCREIALRSAGLLLAGAASAAVMLLVRRHVQSLLPTFPRFALCSMAGAIVYVALVMLTQRDILHFILRMSRGGGPIKASTPEPTQSESSATSSTDDKAILVDDVTCQLVPPPPPEGRIEPVPIVPSSTPVSYD